MTGGILVDLRPMSSKPWIEVVTSRDAVPIAEIDATGRADDDAAADRAVAHAVERQWFSPGPHREFAIEFYWHNVSEMASFIATRKAWRVDVSWAHLQAAHHRVAGGAIGDSRLRCRRQMLLKTYAKRHP